MAYNEQLADRIRELIAARENQVEEKQMFGGLCFMVNDKMCVTTREDRIMVRLAPEDYEAEVLGEGCSPMVHGGREMKGFIFVSADTLGSTEALKRWVDLALDFNATLDEEPEEEPEEEVVTVVVIDEVPEAPVKKAAPVRKTAKKAAPAKKAVKKAAKGPAKKASKKAASKKAAPKKAAKKAAKRPAKKAVKKAPVRKTAKKAPARKAAKKGGRKK